MWRAPSALRQCPSSLSLARSERRRSARAGRDCGPSGSRLQLTRPLDQACEHGANRSAGRFARAILRGGRPSKLAARNDHRHQPLNFHRRCLIESLTACPLFPKCIEHPCPLRFNQACRQFMKIEIDIHGSRVGLARRTTIDNPQRFAHARCYRDLSSDRFAPGNISPSRQHVRCQASKRSGVLKAGVSRQRVLGKRSTLAECVTGISVCFRPTLVRGGRVVSKTLCAIHVLAASGDARDARAVYKTCGLLRPDGVSAKMRAHLCGARLGNGHQRGGNGPESDYFSGEGARRSVVALIPSILSPRGWVRLGSQAGSQTGGNRSNRQTFFSPKSFKTGQHLKGWMPACRTSNQ